jgi:hypothetical protein
VIGEAVNMGLPQQLSLTARFSVLDTPCPPAQPHVLVPPTPESINQRYTCSNETQTSSCQPFTDITEMKQPTERGSTVKLRKSP